MYKWKKVTKRILAERMASRFSKDINMNKGLDCILDSIIETLGENGRVEIRRFGSFSLRHWGPRHARNPLTGKSRYTEPRYSVHFKMSSFLKSRLMQKHDIENEDKRSE